MVQETEEDKVGIVSEGSVEVGGDDDIDRMERAAERVTKKMRKVKRPRSRSKSLSKLPKVISKGSLFVCRTFAFAESFI
jgi:hypothetical protein